MWEELLSVISDKSYPLESMQEHLVGYVKDDTGWDLTRGLLNEATWTYSVKTSHQASSLLSKVSYGGATPTQPTTNCTGISRPGRAKV